MKTEFCSICGSEIVPSGCSTGYGTNDKGAKICFECIGVLDRKTLLETGEIYGYLSGTTFSNWPGSFKVENLYIRKSNHNFAGRDGRSDFWFTLEGQNFHGVHIGNNNKCAKVKRVK